jgi:hypothetical protein
VLPESVVEPEVLPESVVEPEVVPDPEVVPACFPDFPLSACEPDVAPGVADLELEVGLEKGIELRLVPHPVKMMKAAAAVSAKVQRGWMKEGKRKIRRGVEVDLVFIACILKILKSNRGWG